MNFIFSTDVMEHVLNLGAFMYAVNQALKPGGLAIIRVPYRESLMQYVPQIGAKYPFVHLRNFNKSLLRDIISAAGMKLREFHFMGFVPGTPNKFWMSQYPLKKVYGFFVSWLRNNLKNEAEVNEWPTWFNLILMRPTELLFIVEKPGG